HLLNAPLQAGEYQVRPKQSSASIFGMLWRGEGVLRQLTIPEGLTSYQIVHIINTAPAMVGQITTLPPEGSLLPETYRYSYGTSRYDMMQTMQQHMQKTIAHLWEKRPSNYPLQTMQHFVTLASIVEKETGVAAERARVAGVFINRLRMGMKLQSDPTVIYGLSEGKGFLDRPLLRKDWLHQHPINTYVIDGLPPQPIANPGLAALQATLSPETHDLIYFVADGTGGHVFASNLKDHNTNVAAWQKINAKKNSP
ncbi:MAG: endolytic transglycosylase MltG, partial [Alphaproteobacteria bacterium]|nr:endolytic transglycosylase MltG [Alphaproteobacteria bacterium]